MADARLEKTTARIDIAPVEANRPQEQFVANGEVVQFEGFMRVYVEGDDLDEADGDEGVLPALAKGDDLRQDTVTARQRYTKPPARYTEASLVKKMEELGIGRPSTYAPTISTIIDRGYVEKDSREGKPRQYVELVLDKSGALSGQTLTENTGAEKSKLFPTDIGRVVNDFLVKQFGDIIDYSFTANLEKELDQVADGKTEWGSLIKAFYDDFHPAVERSTELDREYVNTSRPLGQHPETGLPVSVRLGRYGPMVQLGEAEGETKPAYASLRKEQRLDTITLEEALDLFKLPRNLGEVDGEKVTAALGRFGPYVKYKSKFVSIPAEESPLEISLERALELYAAKELAEANKIIKVFEENADAKVLNGKYGPYVVFGDRNLKIAKGTDPAGLTYEAVLALAEEQKDKPPGRRAPTSKTATKPGAKATKAKAATTTAAKKPVSKVKAVKRK